VATKLGAKHLRASGDVCAVNEGVEWIILTNGAEWRAYHLEVAVRVVMGAAEAGAKTRQMELPAARVLTAEEPETAATEGMAEISPLPSRRSFHRRTLMLIRPGASGGLVGKAGLVELVA
jgi:hypothetical protein